MVKAESHETILSTMVGLIDERDPRVDRDNNAYRQGKYKGAKLKKIAGSEFSSERTAVHSIAVLAMAAEKDEKGNPKYSIEQLLDDNYAVNEKSKMFDEVYDHIAMKSHEGNEWLADKLHNGRKALALMEDEYASSIDLANVDIKNGKVRNLMIIGTIMHDVHQEAEHIKKEMEVSIQAGEIVGRIYDALLAQYGDNSTEALRWLNILCVRIVFCLYAEDAGIFTHDQFHDFLAAYEAKDIRRALCELFEVLKTPIEQRSKYLQDELKAFPYTNGGLFEEEIEIPQFTEELKQTLLHHASLDFDWSEISPTIFGAVFESTLNPETRRSGGMHYTSIENIHKVIDPLFLNGLRRELDDILEEKVERQRAKRLDAYQERLASLTFLDPACGSGNFLTETYLSLRRLENEVIRERYHGQMMMGEMLNPVKVSIHQFYGIEINDFAVTVATTALWISEAQMLAETEKIIMQDIDFLPLKSYSNIREGNALRMDWDVMEVTTGIPTIHAKNVHLIIEQEPMMVSESHVEYDDINVVTQYFDGEAKPEKQRYQVTFDYIIGNPPFIGYTFQTPDQKADLASVCAGCGKNIDYVAGWYYKAAQLIGHGNTRAALVSTNSITQGEQVTALWKNLIEQYGMRIDFAHRTFRWDSEATLKAHVHCVIVGFSSRYADHKDAKVIYDGGKEIEAENINPYLINGPTIFLEKRKQPLAAVPQMCKGSQPTDGGHLILSPQEREQLLSKSPSLAKYVRPFVGADEFINGKSRFCLWLKNANPSDIKSSEELLRRINAVKEMRQASAKAATRKWAVYPTLFTENRQPESAYIIVPRVSSERRRYVPMGFMSPNVIASDAVHVIPDATLYLFGVLESNVHMAWMRAVCGRLEMRYRYSNDIVYNNFPWPDAVSIKRTAEGVTNSPSKLEGVPGGRGRMTEAQKARIEQTAQDILDARALYPDSSLADLYDELTMPPELRRAHQDNDRAVMQAYGFDVRSMTESQCVAELFRRYQVLTSEQTN